MLFSHQKDMVPIIFFSPLLGYINLLNANSELRYVQNRNIQPRFSGILIRIPDFSRKVCDNAAICHVFRKLDGLVERSKQHSSNFKSTKIGDRKYKNHLMIAWKGGDAPVRASRISTEFTWYIYQSLNILPAIVRESLPKGYKGYARKECWTRFYIIRLSLPGSLLPQLATLYSHLDISRNPLAPATDPQCSLGIPTNLQDQEDWLLWHKKIIPQIRGPPKKYRTAPLASCRKKLIHTPNKMA